MSKAGLLSSSTSAQLSSRPIIYVLAVVLATICLSWRFTHIANISATQPHNQEKFSFLPPNITRTRPDIKLDRRHFINTPDLPIWDPKKKQAFKWASCLVVAACISDDRSALYINGQQFFPPRDVNSPPKLRALQGELTSGRPTRQLVKEVVLFDVDYKLDVKMVSRDKQNSGFRRLAEIDGHRYYDGVYELTLDILGAGVLGGIDTLLRSPEQHYIKLMIHIESFGDSWRYDESGNFIEDKVRLGIESSVVLERGPFTYTFPYVAGSRSVCRIWSWRCADLNESPWYASTYDGPWYSIAMRHEFDEFGRIGCGRRAVVKVLYTLQEVVGGPEGVKILLVIGGAMLLWYIRWYFKAIASFYIIIAKVPWRMITHFYRLWKEDRKQNIEFKRLEDEGQDLDYWSEEGVELPRHTQKVA